MRMKTERSPVFPMLPVPLVLHALALLLRVNLR